MAHCPIKTRPSHLIAAMISLFIISGTALAAPDTQSLQPQGLNHAGIYGVRQIDPDLTGSGVKIALVSRSITYIDGKPQNDYQPAAQHNCFKDTRYVFHGLSAGSPAASETSPEGGQEAPAGVSGHSTAVCSILFGRDPNAYNEHLGRFVYEGAAPDAQADVYEFWNFLINNVFPFSAPEADVITADVGYQFEDWWTRGIEAMAQQYGLTVVVGIGNGYNSSDPALYPGAGGNVIGVGVVQAVDTGDTADGLSRFALALPEHSSQGPTSDGRSKPDIVAPGNCLAAAAGEPNRYEPTGSWSSFATPIVAGTAGLLIQKAKTQSDLQSAVSREGGNCVIKSILLNSAAKLPYWHKGRLSKDDDHGVPLDWLQGAGMVNALEAYNQLLAGHQPPGNTQPNGWDLNKLQCDETPVNIYKFTLAEQADKVITATVTWNKHFETSYPFEHQAQKDCDIRLELWAIDKSDVNNTYLLDYSDSRTDNVEHIYCPADANITEYEIVVSLSGDHDVEQPADSAPYGLCWSVSQAPQRDDALWLDLNADGVVGQADVSVLLDNILTSIESLDRYVLGDVNSDGRLDAGDLNIFLKRIVPAFSATADPPSGEVSPSADETK